MQPHILSVPRPGDEAALRRLWKRVFHDPDEYIDSWFRYWYDPELSLCVREEDIVSMGFLLDVGHFLGKPCAMVYAVATDVSRRGRGLASALVRGLRETAEKRGFGSTVLRPAEPSLFGFYREHTGHLPVFTASSGAFTGGGRPGAREALPEEYRALREVQLEKMPHLALSERALAWFVLSGGRLWRIGENACAATEAEDGQLILKELLCDPGRRRESSLSVAHACGAASCLARWPDKNGAPFAMADVSGQAGAWMGLAFD
jgi:GNAT superfamily N-acetyltransferase